MNFKHELPSIEHELVLVRICVVDMTNCMGSFVPSRLHKVKKTGRPLLSDS